MCARTLSHFRCSLPNGSTALTRSETGHAHSLLSLSLSLSFANSPPSFSICNRIDFFFPPIFFFKLSKKTFFFLHQFLFFHGGAIVVKNTKDLQTQTDRTDRAASGSLLLIYSYLAIVLYFVALIIRKWQKWVRFSFPFCLPIRSGGCLFS